MYIDPNDEKWQAAVSRYECIRDYARPLHKMNRALLGRDKQMKALLATFERAELSNALLLASPGSGKALDNTTPIPVNDERGYVRIGDIRVGDETFDERGVACKVTGVFPQGQKRCYEVLFEHGERIVCNDEHLWEVRERISGSAFGDWRTMSLAEIVKEGVATFGGQTRWYVPCAKSIKRKVAVCVTEMSDFVRDGVVFLPLPDDVLMAETLDRSGMITSLTTLTADSLLDGERGIVCSTRDVAITVAALVTSVGMRADIIDQGARILVTRDWVDSEAIVSIRDMGVERPMTCITVDSKRSLFICGSCHVVTHNTALVQGTMAADDSRIYLEVDLSRMIADLANVDELGDRLKRLFAEAADFTSRSNKGLVLFMDEFHQIIQISPAAVEALKPLLADSATRGIRVIAATTNREFSEFVEPNQPLVERFTQIRLHEPDRATVVAILESMAETYGVSDAIIGTALYETIYDVTERHMVSEAQPRKSIMMLDAMVGWHRYAKRKMNKQLLADVMYEQRNINISFAVNASAIRRELDEHVFAQEYATRAVEQRLQLSVAGLGDPTKPQGSFLLTGSTGVGKDLANSTPVPAVSPKDGSLIYINHGDLKPGDVIFDAHGRPTRVLRVFPHKDVPMYRITFSDGRVIEAGDNHLWAVYTSKMRNDIRYRGGICEPRIMTTQDIVDAGVVCGCANGSRKRFKWFIPMNEAVQCESVSYVVDPYVVGAFIGNGRMLSPWATLLLLGDDVEVVDEVSRLIRAVGYRMAEGCDHGWQFAFDEDTAALFGDRWYCQGRLTKYLRTRTVFGDMPEVMCVDSSERRIPERYMHGSIEQRWALVQGLFDTCGSVSDDDRARVSYSTFSKGLADDIVQLLYSLGISSRYVSRCREREDEYGNVRVVPEYTVRVRCAAEDKPKFFRLERKRACAEKAVTVSSACERATRFGMVGIESIEPIGVQDAQCILVDNPEHLYQAGQFVVTHNTELVKQLARILFPEGTDALVRLDMTEYANPDSLERFRLELTSAVSVQPYCIILLDEVEKACAPVTRILLSVLDDARLTDRHGRIVSFVNSYIVLTTNAGSEIYKTIAQYESSDDGSGEFVSRYDKLIRRSLMATTGGNRFPPELLGRIDTIVPFQPLSEQTMERICKTRIADLRAKLMEMYGVKMEVSKRVVSYLIKDSLSTDSDSGGARAVVSKLESEVTTNVAAFVNRFPQIRTINVDVRGQLASENKSRLTSDAYVVVRGVDEG